MYLVTYVDYRNGNALATALTSHVASMALRGYTVVAWEEVAD